MLAEALDADELDSYERFLLAGGDKKKWKWSSSDKAGTQRISKGVGQVEQTLRKATFDLFKVDVETFKKNTARPNRAKEFAEITGRPWVLMNPDGVYFSKDAQIIVPPFEYNTMIIKIDYNGNEI